ncbi:MAG TPA: hypothetical protein VNT53_03815 [Pseudolysinimonas sp.]|nr:hypothetical protein [Pseudolysinimonas sp.]
MDHTHSADRVLRQWTHASTGSVNDIEIYIVGRDELRIRIRSSDIGLGGADGDTRRARRKSHGSD